MNKIVYILMGCAGLAMVAFLVIKEFQADEQAPQILVDENVVVDYSPGCSESVLLTGVKAQDNADGDITEDVIVENVYDFGNGQVKVSYAVKDAAGNIAKAERLIAYDTVEPSEEPVSQNALDLLESY